MRILGLASTTTTDWIARATAAMPEILVDHAHCEKKAASTAIGLMFKYVERTELLQPLSSLAREELAHFEIVLQVLDRRGLRMTRMRPSPYASRLLGGARITEPDRLLDVLLCAALIEARSCERMRLLAEHLQDAELADLYRSLLASEARHHATYLDLAKGIFGRPAVERRFQELAEHEAEVLAAMPPGLRLHS